MSAPEHQLALFDSESYSLEAHIRETIRRLYEKEGRTVELVEECYRSPRGYYLLQALRAGFVVFVAAALVSGASWGSVVGGTLLVSALILPTAIADERTERRLRATTRKRFVETTESRG